MKVKNKIKLLMVLTMVVVFSILFSKYIVKAVFVTLDDIKNNNYQFTISYEKDMEAGYIHKLVSINGTNYNVFCREKDGTLWGAGHGVSIYYYKMLGLEKHASTKSSDPDKRKLAKLLYEFQGNTISQQRIIWASDLNSGTETEYQKWNNTTVGEYIKPKITVTANNAKSKSDGDNYKIGPIKVNYEGGTNGEATLSNQIEIIDAQTNRTVTTITKNEIIKNENFYISVPKSELEDVKEVKIKMKVTGDYYEVDYVYFVGTGYSADNQVVDASGQRLIAVNPKMESESDEDESETIKLTQPRLITTKYIKNIQHENGKTSYLSGLPQSGNTIPNSWNPDDWGGYNNLKPTVTVDINKDVEAKNRYNLIKQNTSMFNVSYGDIITYNIRIYNVGNEDIELDTTDLEIDLSLTNNDAGGVLRKEGDSYYLYDYPSDNLEFIAEQDFPWYKDGDKWVVDIADVKNPHLGNYEEDKDKGIDAWSSYVSIKFRITGKNGNDEKGEMAQEILVENNAEFGGPTPVRKDTGLKFLYSFTYTDAEHNEKEYTCKEPVAKIDESLPVGDKDRLTYSFIEAPTVTIQDQSRVTYCVRYYSIANNDIQLTYKFEDNFGEGLEFIEAKDKNGNTITTIPKDERSIYIPPPDIVLPGYDGGEIPYYDVYLTFKVNLKDRKDIKILTNELKGDPDTPPPHDPDPNEIIIVREYKIKGKVFIDNQDTNNKTTIPRDEIWSEGSDKYTENPDKPVEGIEVQLLNEDGSPAGIEVEGKRYIQDPQTKELYPTFTKTDANGEYTFEHLRSVEFYQKFWDGKLIEEGSKDVSKPYRVVFTYNGQEYENIHYNSDDFKGNGSYATEGNTNRENFNKKFTTINTSNSTELSLKQLDGETNSRRDVKYIDQGFVINAYTGQAGLNSNASNGGLINYYTSYIEHVNLGLVKRTFSLALENQLDSMEVSINGDKTILKSNYGKSLQQTLDKIDISYDGIKYIEQEDTKQEVYFKESDYSYQEETKKDNELQVRVNYKVTVYNNSPDKFIGILNAINLHYDNRFNDIKVTIDGAECDTSIIDSAGSFQGSRITLKGGKKLGNTADDNKVEIKISFLLTREQIAEAILASDTDTLKTLEMIAEIESYGSEYNGDTFNNGHTGNAGKIDENSDSGNFDIKDYIDKKSKADWDAAAYFNKEDDCHRATIIKLKSDDNPRTLEGTVFEDATEKTDISGGQTRLGNGKYDLADDDRQIEGVKVDLIDSTNNNNIEENIKNGIDSTMTEDKAKDKVIYTAKTSKEGTYTLSGFIPSTGYIIKFTYGNGETLIYNAQDYKSTIDKSKLNYETHTSEAGNKYGWYSDVIDKTDSVAKDTDMKMKESLKLTNESAKYLENYENAGTTKILNDQNSDQYFKNTAVTAKMYVGLKWEGNSNYAKETYNIKNINLGLAERPRAELKLTKEVDHISIVATDGSTIVDGTVEQSKNDGVKSISWTSRYVQPIIDESLIFGSTMKVTYKFKIENTGEVDYYNKYANNVIGGNGREFYDYGKSLDEQYIVTTKPTSLVDYVDNKLIYDEDTISYNGEENSIYWKPLDTNERINEGLHDYKEINTILKLNTTDGLKELKPGEGKDDYIAYLTFEKVLSDAMAEDLLTYNNYAEITGSENSAGRRSYSTWKKESGNYYLLSDMRISDTGGEKAERGIVNIDDETEDIKNKDRYVLTIPGNLNPVKAYNGDWSTLYDPVEKSKPHGEPDSDQAQETQIIQPFGASTSQRILIWTITGTVAGLILVAGIYLIKKKVI